ncbi:MAG TPA: DoxX family protein [Puia sp.]|nr:DoxX family protein [Puia sp.]
MSALQQIKQWSAVHHPRWLVIVRIGLGIFLFVKGISFMRDSALLDELIYGQNYLAKNTTNWLPIIVTFANLLGGFMLMIGLWTRLIALLEIPILVGAIININSQKGGFAPESELWLAILVLLLLVFFLIEGGGPLSMDGYFDRNRRSTTGTNMP